jgi:hypothetical protein
MEFLHRNRGNPQVMQALNTVFANRPELSQRPGLAGYALKRSTRTEESDEMRREQAEMRRTAQAGGGMDAFYRRYGIEPSGSAPSVPAPAAQPTPAPARPAMAQPAMAQPAAAPAARPDTQPSLAPPPAVRPDTQLTPVVDTQFTPAVTPSREGGASPFRGPLTADEAARLGVDFAQYQQNPAYRQFVDSQR